MPSFDKGGGIRGPFGRNEFLRSTNPKPQTESYTLAADTITAQTIDGVAGQKIVQPGLAMAKITSGPNAGKVGPYQAAGTKEVQTLTKAGTISGGTFTLTFDGDTTDDIDWDATAATVQAELNGLNSVAAVGGVVVTGGPIDTSPFTVTFQSGANVALITADTTDLTGSGAGITVAEGTAGAPGATDGRQLAENLVGLNLTFLPWQTIERDVEIAVVTDATCVQAWCTEYDANGASIALTNATADALRGKKRLDIKFA